MDLLMTSSFGQMDQLGISQIGLKENQMMIMMKWNTALRSTGEELDYGMISNVMLFSKRITSVKKVFYPRLAYELNF